MMPPITSAKPPRDREHVGSVSGRTASFRWLSFLCIAAFAVRVVLFWRFPGIAHPDEMFQYLEQANRLIRGVGLVPWEFQIGIRSWIIPGSLAGILRIVHLFADDPVLERLAIAAVLALLALIPVFCGFRWALAVGGFGAALCAGVLNAFWYELVYLSVHPLPDTFAASFLVLGLYLAAPSGDGAETDVSRLRLLIAGFMLGLAFLLRLHLLPAIGIIFTAVCVVRFATRAVPMFGGFLLSILAAGVLDALTLGSPWQSIWLFLWVNIGLDVASGMGADPWYTYLSVLGAGTSYTLAIFFLAWLHGAPRVPLLFTVAVTIFLTLSVIAHKEYRFLYPALPLLMTVAGIGFAARVEPLLARQKIILTPLKLGLAGVGVWLVISITVGSVGRLSGMWTQNVGVVRAMQTVSTDQAACGVAIYPAAAWFAAGGHALLRPGLGLKGFSPGDPDMMAAGFNAIVTDDNPDFSRLGFRRDGCWDENWTVTPGELWDRVCLWRRSGGCDQNAAADLVATTAPWLAERLGRLNSRQVRQE